MGRLGVVLGWFGKEVVMTTVAQDSQVYSMVDGPQLMMRLKIMRAMCRILREHARETWEGEEDKEEEEEEEEEEEAKEEWGMGIIEQII
jgi:hypothetical protein